MKSAYELAMERLEAASGPTKRLTDEERAAIAEIDNKFDAEIAALRIDFEARLAAADSYETHTQVKEEMAREIARAEERREDQKDAIWDGK